MNFIDILIIVPTIWYAFKGFRKGLIFELAGIVALIAGTWIAINFSNKTADIIGLTGKYVDIIAFIITFAIVIFLVYIFAKFIEKIVTFVIPEFLNNIGGAVVGGFKIVLIISILLYFINSLDKFELFIKKDKKESSLFYKPVISIAPLIFPDFRTQKADSLDIKKSKEKKKFLPENTK